MADEVRIERMRPEQIDAAKARRPAIYVPFGAIEWHGYHNPVGLDALKAHAQLVRLAERCGGVVYPPIYFGAGGGHTTWPHTFMVGADPMRAIVAQLLAGFERDGYATAILLSGHYPNRNEYLDHAIADHRAAGGTICAMAIVEHQAEGVRGDHAAKYETSSMLHLDPSLVDMTALDRPPTDDVRGPEERVDFMLDEFRGHPCYGLVGIDPRGGHASADVGRDATERLVAFLAAWLDGGGR